MFYRIYLSVKKGLVYIAINIFKLKLKHYLAKDEREEEGYDFPGHDIRSPKRAADLTKDECKQVRNFQYFFKLSNF